MKKSYKYNQDYIYIIAGFFFIFLAHLPLLILGEDAIVRYYDNLDCDFIYLHVLKISGHLFCVDPSHIIPTIFDGITTGSIHSSFNLINVFFYLMPSFWAYVFNGLTIRIIGFIGSWFLLKNHFKLPNKVDIFLLSIFYSLLPLFTIYGLTIVGLPLLYYAFMNLSIKKNVIFNLCVIFIYVFYSHFFLIGPFLIIFLLFLGIYKKLFINPYWLGLICFILTAVFTNLLFFNEYFLGEVSNRVEMKKQVMDNTSFIHSFLFSLSRTFLFGVEHFSAIIIAPIILIAVILKTKIKSYGPLLWVFLFTLLMVIYEFYLPTLPFNVSRFTALSPLLIFIFLGRIFTKIKSKNAIWVRTLLIVQILINCFNDIEIGQNTTAAMGFKSANLIETINTSLIRPFNKKIKEKRTPYSQIAELGIFGSDLQIRERTVQYEDVTYKQFFSVSAFDKIKKELPSNARIINVGFHPAISQYNGLSTLDSYQNFYPLRYKKQFQKLIQYELNKDEAMRMFFETWGNRVYAFSAELDEGCKFDCHKLVSQKNTIENFHIDEAIFKKMGGTHIISSVEINDFNGMNFSLINKVDDPQSRYVFHLYKLN